MSIEYNNSQIITLVNNNIVTMYLKRGFKNVSINSTTDSNIYELKGDDLFKKIYLSPKLANISNNTPLDIFLSNAETDKILIAKDFSKKVLNQILNNYNNTEYFFEHEVIEDITEKIFNPKFELLDNESKKKLLNVISDNELSKIYSTDVMCRYYGGNVNDIFKIIRPSITSGYSIFYRKVITGNINSLFQK